MDGNVIGLIIAAAVIGLPILAVVILVVWIVFKFRQLRREAGLSRQDLINGIRKSKQVARTPSPVSLNGMDRIYIPRITRDHPDFQLSAIYPQVETLIKTFLDCLEAKDVSALEKLSIAPDLVDRARQIIQDLDSQGLRVYYDNIVVHKTVISEYVKEDAMTIIRFQSSVGYTHYSVNENGKVVSGDREGTEETVYVTSYARLHISEQARQSGDVRALGINCPNCGAPLSSIRVSYCEFCGTGIKNLADYVFAWTFTDIKEKNLSSKKLY